MVPAGSAAVAAYETCGFEQAGTLREHRFEGGKYQDVNVYVANREDACQS
jgi:RimJ/RimL family protein N-acetyltransferase